VVAPFSARDATGRSMFPPLSTAGGVPGSSLTTPATSTSATTRGMPAPPGPPPAHGVAGSSAQLASGSDGGVRLPALAGPAAKEQPEAVSELALVPYAEAPAASDEQQMLALAKMDNYAIVEFQQQVALAEQRHSYLLSYATQVEDLKQTILDLREQLAEKAAAETDLRQQLEESQHKSRMKDLEVEACKQQLQEADDASKHGRLDPQVIKEKWQHKQVEFQVLGAKTEAKFYADAVSDMIRQQKLEVQRLVATERAKLLQNFETKIASADGCSLEAAVLHAWRRATASEEHQRHIEAEVQRQSRLRNAHIVALECWDVASTSERLMIVMDAWSSAVPGGRSREAIRRQHVKEAKDENREKVSSMCWKADFDRFRLRSVWSRWLVCRMKSKHQKAQKKVVTKSDARFDRTLVAWATEDTCARLFIVLRAWEAWMCLQTRRDSAFSGNFGPQISIGLHAGDSMESSLPGFQRTFQIDWAEDWRSVMDNKIQEILAETANTPGELDFGGASSTTCSGGPSGVRLEELGSTSNDRAAATEESVLGENGGTSSPRREALNLPANLSLSIWDSGGNPVSSADDARLPETAFPLTVELAELDAHHVDSHGGLENLEASHGLGNPWLEAPKMTASLSMLSQYSHSGVRRGVASSTVQSAARHRHQRDNLIISVSLKCWEQERMLGDLTALVKAWATLALYRRKPHRTKVAAQKAAIDRAVLRWGSDIDLLAVQATFSSWSSLLKSQKGAAARARYDHVITKAAALWSSDARDTHLEIVLHSWKEVVAQKWKEAAQTGGNKRELEQAEKRAEVADREAQAALKRAEAAEAAVEAAKKKSSCCVLQ